jgi:tRNA(Ile)-lysidine synthase
LFEASSNFIQGWEPGLTLNYPLHNTAGVLQQVSKYDVCVHDLAQPVLSYLRKHAMLRAGDRVSVAVSGGADSVALLRILLELRAELGIVLSVVHFNHKLREPEAALDEEFVRTLAQSHGLQFHAGYGDVKGYAAAHQLSVEAAARRLRYRYFGDVLSHERLNRTATAHTLDDQAETVLLRIVRGAGTRGLAGIYPHVALVGGGSIIRPLLSTPRKDLLQYLADIKQEWREDGSNRDLRFSRNRIRHGVLPRLERNFNPAVRETLAEAAEIARVDEEYWAAEVSRALPCLWTVASGRGVLQLTGFSRLPLALRRRLLLHACETMGFRIDFKHVEELTALCGNDGPRSVGLPQAWTAHRDKDAVCFSAATTSAPANTDYEYALSIPGEAVVAETGTRFRAVLVPLTAYNPEHLLDRESVGTQVTIRNWRPGDRFWPAHTKGPKKIKELLRERKITGSERQVWPVAVNTNEVVWVRGFLSPTKLRPADAARDAIFIEELGE